MVCVVLQPWLKNWKIQTSFKNSKIVIADKMIDYIERNSYVEKYTDMEFQNNTTPQFLWHAKYVGANFEHFWVANRPQLTNKCWNIGPPWLQIGLPNLLVSFFSALGPIKAMKFSNY
jgi:hypothetical protein